jgi:hypothetical protein
MTRGAVRVRRNALRWLAGGLLVTLPSARAAAWAPPALERAPVNGEVAGQLSVAGEAALGSVPPFRSAPRDRWRVGPAASAWFGSRVRLGVDWDWMWDRTPLGEEASGPGDIRLAAAVRAATLGPVRLGVGWEAKMPNARNEEELGTDETDVTFGAWGRLDQGPLQAGLAVGLGVRGNPLRYASQDDVPLVLADVGASAGRWGASAFCHAEFPTAINPARVEAGARLRVGRAWFFEAEGAGGLTPAAPDGRVLLRVGFSGALPESTSRE